jgi:hypothetical protein
MKTETNRTAQVDDLLTLAQLEIDVARAAWRHPATMVEFRATCQRALGLLMQAMEREREAGAVYRDAWDSGGGI